MLSCTRRIEFDAAHRVIGHQGKCKNFHGHRYVVEATFVASELNELGMVIDFSIIKSILGAWIDEHLDHNAILHHDDHAIGEAICSYTKQRIYYLHHNPTAENIAHHLLHEICPMLFAKTQVRCIKIRLYETPNCYAEATES